MSGYRCILGQEKQRLVSREEGVKVEEGGWLCAQGLGCSKMPVCLQLGDSM